MPEPDRPTTAATAERRPHLLYVAWGYPPCRGGGVYRALATANAFAEGGWDVTVLTVERDIWERYTGADPTLEERIDPRITVERVPFAWPNVETDLRRWPRSRVYAPGAWRRMNTRREQIPFPEISYGPWRTVIEPAAARIHQRRPVDLTLATANPHVAFTAAYHLYEKYRVPYVMDYRDAWTLDVFDGKRLHEKDSRAAKWEAKLFATATEVWFVNEPIAAWHRQEYPATADRIHVVANGWDADLAPDHDPEVPAADRPLVFGYIGTVSPKVPLEPFVDGWRIAVGSTPELAGARAVIRGYLGFYKTPNPLMVDLIDGARDVGLSYGGPVGKTEVHEVYEDFDVCLLILGTGKYVTSGKVFEYLSTGKPVVSVHDPGNAASDVMRGYPLWFPAASLEPADIAAALSAAAVAARTASIETRQACRDFGARYRRDLQLAPRVESLRESAIHDVRRSA